MFFKKNPNVKPREEKDEVSAEILEDVKAGMTETQLKDYLEQKEIYGD